MRSCITLLGAIIIGMAIGAIAFLTIIGLLAKPASG